MDINNVVIYSVIAWAVVMAYYISIKFLKLVIISIQVESKAWREAYVAKEYGSTIIGGNVQDSNKSIEQQSDMEQQTGLIVEPSIQEEDYAHLVSKTTKPVVSFGEDVSS
jgi:hypothetical protein